MEAPIFPELREIGQHVMDRIERLKLLNDSRLGDKAYKLDADHLMRHYRQRPFDLLHDEVHHIVTLGGNLEPFKMNDEQREMCRWLEQTYYAQKPVRARGLKCRQHGSTTFWILAIQSLLVTSTDKSAHFVSDCNATADNGFRMFWNSFMKLPRVIRPRHKSDSPAGTKYKLGLKNKREIVFDDPEFGCGNSLFRRDSAESRDKIPRSWTYQWNLFDEKAFWPEMEEIAGALNPTVPDGWPSIIAEISTGNSMGDIFYTDCCAAESEEDPLWKFFWFPVQTHRAYSLPLNMPEKQFMESLRTDLKRRVKLYDLTPEQIHWYKTKEATYRDRAIFQREYPMCKEECFLGGGRGFFAGDQMQRDIAATSERKHVPLDKLPMTVSRSRERGPIKYTTCILQRDRDHGYANPFFEENEAGHWEVYERPRPNHIYAISLDGASGRASRQKKRHQVDNSVIDVTRISWEPGEIITHSQVAQYCFNGIDPRDLAREAKAAAMLYRDGRAKDQACAIVERNGDGLTTIEQGKDDHMRFYLSRDIGDYGFETADEIGIRTTTGTPKADQSRMALITNFREVWLGDRYLVSSKGTALEMNAFVKNHTSGRWEAASGNKDDRVTTAYLAIECVRFINQQSTAPIEVQKLGDTKVQQQAPEQPSKPVKVWQEYPELKKYFKDREKAYA